MLERLDLHNFQKWDDISIDFDPLVTILFGKSGIGKSCLLRGLTWICLNEPRGDKYIKRGQKECSASLSVDGRTLKRYRDPYSNGYELSGQVYEALNGSVPEPISNLLKLSDTNFSDQYSAPYWLLLPKPEVARQLNAIVNLDLIDRTLENLSLQARRAKDSVSETNDNLVKARHKRDSLSWVKEADKALREIEELDKEREDTESKSSSLSSLLSRLEIQETLLLNGEKEMESLMEVLDLGNRIEHLQQQIRSLSSFVTRLENIEGITEETERDSEKIRNSLSEYGKNRCPECGKNLNPEERGEIECLNALPTAHVKSSNWRTKKHRD